MRPLLIPALFGLAVLSSPELGHTTAAAAIAAPQSNGVISGVAKNPQGDPIEGASVTLRCGDYEASTTTNASGLYAFREIPTGSKCVVRLLAGKSDTSKIVSLPSGARFRANFKVDPGDSAIRAIEVKNHHAPRMSRTSARSVQMEEFRNIPVGSRTSRSFTQVVESSATASRDSAGVALPNREGYAHTPQSDFKSPLDHPLSTFAADVDTASYSNVRRMLDDGALPPVDAVRIEEFVNYFEYDYKKPTGDRPVAVNWEISTCPWDSSHYLARIGLQTRPIADEAVAPRNLVFLLDVSGSMARPDKLPLLKRAMNLLVDNLREQDRISLVVYAGAAGLVLPPTHGDDRSTIRDALTRLESGGSTNGAGGIHLAYETAQRSFIKGGINRVILATDGDFNVGARSDGELIRIIEKKRRSGVSLSVLGFGSGNLQDSTMEQLADHGNGNYAYIDDIGEARKVLVEQAGATLVTVAKDVKLQVEFNPTKVAEYRLIGYDNRLLADEDFDDDTKDAGELGAGHSMTALYELVPASADQAPTRKIQPLRYQQRGALARSESSDEWMTVAVRYKAPQGRRSRRFEVPMRGTPHAFAQASRDLRFAAAVAAFGMDLRRSDRRGNTSLDMIRTIARKSSGADLAGHRKAFIELVDRTKQLRQAAAQQARNDYE